MSTAVLRSFQYQPTHSVSGNKNNWRKCRSRLRSLRARHVVINVEGIKTHGVVIASNVIAIMQSSVKFGLIVRKEKRTEWLCHKPTFSVYGEKQDKIRDI
jgi:hypothetical protein